MDTEMLQPQERGDDKPLVTVHVGNTDMVDVIDDNSVINHVQRRRLAFIAEISPDGRIENKKDRHLYLQAMSDTASLHSNVLPPITNRTIVLVIAQSSQKCWLKWVDWDQTILCLKRVQFLNRLRDSPIEISTPASS